MIHRLHSLFGFSFLALITVFALNQSAWGQDNEELPSVEFDYEIDPYYSNVSAIWPLTNAAIPTVELKNERKIYLDLLKNIFSPRFFLVEASVNPLPVLGVYTRKHHADIYAKGRVNDDLNIIQAFTQGFEEPYALSFFVGNVLKFKTPDGSEDSINKGYSGLLLSVGDQHIKDNILIDDNWYEIEWKLKGDKRTDNDYWSWSFRVGTKMHENVNISDVNYVGIRREVFPNKPGNYGLWDNLGIDFRMDFQRASQDLVQSQVFLERRWPSNKYIYNLGLGLVKQDGKYLGALSTGNSELRLIIRPGISF